MLVLMAGLPATGKSTLARALAERCAGVVLDKDIVRSTLFPPAYVEYSADQDDFCVSLMRQTADYLFARHPDLFVFLDGRTFSRRYQIENAIQGATWRIIECVCAEQTAKARLAADREHPARNRDFDLYLRVRDQFEPIALPKLVVDTDLPLQNCVDSAYRYLTRPSLTPRCRGPHFPPHP
ncbi:MAG TPA: AAA family ATPase [Bryobacteraceae bacterium]|nr:AAA family ATPase [Bryobacteraceae bacterium]